MSTPAVDRAVTRRRRRALLLLLGALVAVVVYLLWSFSTGATAVDPDGSGTASSSGQVEGETTGPARTTATGLQVTAPPVDGLAPGVRRPVLVTVTNTGDEQVRLTSVGATVEADDPDCPARTLVVESWTGVELLDEDGTTSVPLTVSMPETGRNQDACQSVGFVLTYAAAGELVR